MRLTKIFYKSETHKKLQKYEIYRKVSQNKTHQINFCKIFCGKKQKCFTKMRLTKVTHKNILQN